MTLAELQEKSQENLQLIYSKAWEDEAFKKALIEDPVNTLNKITKGTLNLDGKTVQVNDQTDSSTIYLNIPVNPKDVELSSDIELTEEELEIIAGGGKVHVQGSYMFGLIEIDILVEW